MTELAIREDHGALSPAVASLAEWAQSARAAHQIAESLVRTSFVPEAFRGNAHEATAAILAGAEVGLSPMAALRSFDIIQGVAAPRANTLRAVVQSQGHEIWVEESTDTRAKVSGRRRGSAQTQTSTWTIDRAKRLGLTSKQNWQKQPQAMLIARATAEVCRLVASDAILGLPYSIEELTDEPSIATSATFVETAPATAKRTARRAPVAPVEEPALDPDEPIDLVPAEPEPAAPAEPDLDDKTDPRDVPATRAQITKLNIQLQEAGITDREEKLQYLSGSVGRGLESSKDLTKAEANTLIDMLEREAAAERETDQGDDSAFEEPML